MKRQKKLILGLLGLAGVVGITLFARTLPTPEALANSASVDIKVQVLATRPAVRIIRPVDNFTSIQSSFRMAVNYNNATRARYQITYKPGTDQERTFNLREKTIEGTSEQASNWSDEIDIDFTSLGGYGNYIIKAMLGDGEGDAFQLKAEDSVLFNYYPAKVDTVTSETNGDPVYIVEFNDDTDIIKIQAYSKDGNKPLFDPEITYQIPNPRPADNKARIVLPFSSYGATSGDYVVKITLYSKNNPSQPLSDTIVSNLNNYNPPSAPAVPNTGGILGQINLSRADYLITGLAIFFLAAIVGLKILLPKKKQSRRTRR